MDDVMTEKNRDSQPGAVDSQTLKCLDLLRSLYVQDGAYFSSPDQGVDVHRFPFRSRHISGSCHELAHLSQFLTQCHPAHKVVRKALSLATAATSAKRNGCKQYDNSLLHFKFL